MPASRQNPNAMRLASRTVCTSAADPEAVVSDVTNDRGATAAQVITPSTTEKGMNPAQRSKRRKARSRSSHRSSQPAKRTQTATETSIMFLLCKRWRP